jgi:hypothetical protein
MHKHKSDHIQLVETVSGKLFHNIEDPTCLIDENDLVDLNTHLVESDLDILAKYYRCAVCQTILQLSEVVKILNREYKNEQS